MNADGLQYFSEDYVTARRRFIDTAKARGAVMHALELEQPAPDNSPLSIDIAWFGTTSPHRIVIHSSGLHGVEGFAGSAIQLALMDQVISVGSDDAVVFVHILNPYGMAYLRRFNEHNVDLNRNFLTFEAKRPPLSEAYKSLNNFLNPSRLPTAGFFYPRLATFILRYGAKALRQAIVEGQYVYPKGLFFGGEKLEQGPSLFQAWLAANMRSIRRGFVIDVHTGLGRSGQESLLLKRSPTGGDSLVEKIERSFTPDGGDSKVGYEINGGYANAFDVPFKRSEMYIVTQEFGTYPSLQVLRALREENRMYHFGDGSIVHPAKLHLKEIFAPSSDTWRHEAITRGISFALEVFERIFDGESGRFF